MSQPVPNRTANIIGSGPNGLAAAITLAQAGVMVTVYEAQPTIGGACSSAQVTLPGFTHDLGSSAFPMGISSPFFRSLPLARFGFDWVQPEIPLAHPLDDGTAVCLERDLARMPKQLGARDGRAWQKFFGPLVGGWDTLVPELLAPVFHLPRHPLQLARFGLPALLPATTLARTLFHDERARALFAGCAAHSVLPLESVLTSAIGIVLAAAGHAVGWPVAGGGSQSLSNALAAYLRELGGDIVTGHPVTALAELPPADVTLCDTSVQTLLALAPDRLTDSYKQTLKSFHPGPGTFKLDWALSGPIPWTAEPCRRAGTVHVCGTLPEIAEAERAPSAGALAPKPYVLLVQPTVCDPSRAPAGRHTAWAYCHVPNGSTDDRAAAIEAQIERFAPGFGASILDRRSQNSAQLQQWDANLTGGDISGGENTPRQLALRPGPGMYATSDPTLFLCSSSTPPGGGVHGMCGFHAATLALKHLRNP